MKTLNTLAVCTLLALPLAAADAEKPATADDAGLPPCCRKELEPGKPLTDGSIYQLESKWTSDYGKEIQLGRLRGRPQVLVMFFAQCEFACPILLKDLKAIETGLPENLRNEVGFTLISFDTKHDTVEALHLYREAQKLSPERWTLLRGAVDDVRELAALLGINFKEDARGQFAHSNLITILNAEGEVVHQVKGLSQPPGPAIAKLRELLGK